MKFSRLEYSMIAVALIVVVFLAGWRWGDTSQAGTFTVRTETAVGRVEPERLHSLPEEERLDLNRATAAQLEALPEIGPTRAQAIVAYRTEHGPFRYVEQLLDVPGIGESTLEALMDYVTVEEARE